MVTYYNHAVNKSQQKYGIDLQAIESSIFQEKYFSITTVGKNLIAYTLNGFGLKETRSYGLEEMQLGLAADLLGYAEEHKNRLRKTFDLITNDPQVATDLVAKNIYLKQKK